MTNSKISIEVNTELINNLILDMLLQSCGSQENPERIDNQCLSAFEDACSYLTERGYLCIVNSRIYELTKRGRDAI